MNVTKPLSTLSNYSQQTTQTTIQRNQIPDFSKAKKPKTIKHQAVTTLKKSKKLKENKK